MSRTKAVHLKSFKKFILTQSTATIYQQILQTLTPPERQLVESNIFMNNWVDYQLWWRLLVAADRLAGTGDLQLIKTIGAFDASENLNSVYKMFIAHMQPATIVKRCNLIWRQYYDTGDLIFIELQGTQAQLQLKNYPDLPRYHELEIIGWMEEALRMTGVKNLRVLHPGSCLAKGDAFCDFRVEWA